MIIRRNGVLLLLALPLLVELVYLLLPTLEMGRMSLNSFGFLSGVRTDLNLKNYEVLVQDPYYARAWLTTLRVTSAAAIGATLLGCVTAYLLWTASPTVRGWMTLVILTPLLVSSVVRAYGWIAIGGPTGLPRLFEAVGLRPPHILFNETSVLIGFVHVYLPIAVLIVLGQLDAIQPSVLRAARSLGGNSLDVLFRVIFPLVYPAIPTAALLIFALSTAAYSIPAILGGGRVLTIAQVVYDEQAVTLNWPRAAALGLSLTLITILVMLVYQFGLTRLSARREVPLL